jgi:hypothetical protein
VTLDTVPFWLYGPIIVIGLTLIAAGIWGIEKNPTEERLRQWPTLPAQLAETIAALPHSLAIQQRMRSASRGETALHSLTPARG